MLLSLKDRRGLVARRRSRRGSIRAGGGSERRRLGTGLTRSRHPDELLVHELADAEIGKLAAVARVLDAAEGQVGCGPARLVDEHHAGVDLPGDALAALDVL